MTNLAERTRQLEHLRREVDAGLQALETGDYMDLDADGLRRYFDEVKAQGRVRRAKTPPSGE